MTVVGLSRRETPQLVRIADATSSGRNLTDNDLRDPHHHGLDVVIHTAAGSGRVGSVETFLSKQTVLGLFATCSRLSKLRVATQCILHQQSECDGGFFSGGKKPADINAAVR